MSYYIFLSISVGALLALGWALWKTTRSIAFPFGIAVLYYWSLHGAWSIVTDQLGGDSQKRYHYLYDKMFAVQLDENYAWTLALYAVFILVVGMTALLSIRPVKMPLDCSDPIPISHDRVIALCGVAAVVSLFSVYGLLNSAIECGTSAYVVTRAPTDIGWFRVHQILNRIALIPASLGVATLLTSGRCRFLVGEVRARHYWAYALLLGFMYCFCVALGNKNELTVSLFSGCLFYVANSTKPKTCRLVVLGLALLACVAFVDFARRFSVSDITSKVSASEIAYSLVRIADSNECFAAHMSLYGILHYELPLTYGSSIYSLLASAVPHLLWPDRPLDIYWYYADGVAAVEGQGYTIHHAAGWYLNFGIAGVVLGAFLLGWIWAELYNNVLRATRQLGASWWRIFCIIGFFTFSAGLPSLVRSGPEVYKSVLVESFFIPVAVLAFARAPGICRARVLAARKKNGPERLYPRRRHTPSTH